MCACVSEWSECSSVITDCLLTCLLTCLLACLFRIAHQQHSLTIREHLLAAEAEQLEYKYVLNLILYVLNLLLYVLNPILYVLTRTTFIHTCDRYHIIVESSSIVCGKRWTERSSGSCGSCLVWRGTCRSSSSSPSRRARSSPYSVCCYISPSSQSMTAALRPSCYHNHRGRWRWNMSCSDGAMMRLLLLLLLRPLKLIDGGWMSITSSSSVPSVLSAAIHLEALQTTAAEAEA